MKFPIPQDWDNVSWCRWSICWPASEQWDALLRGFLTLPQRGWTWDERSGVIVEVQQIGREIASQNLPLNGVIMACNDELLPNAFNNIAIAINNLAGRSGGGECCSSIPNVINNTIQGFVPSLSDGSTLPIWGSVPPVILPEGGYPEGYTSMAEYKLEKCRLAHQTVDGAIGTIRGLGAITVFNLLTIGGLVLASVVSTVFFPPAAIPALLGMMLLLTAGLGILVNLADLMNEHRDELICALYTSNTIENMIVAVEAIMATIVIALPVATAFQILCKGIAMMFFSSDSLNGLMSFTAALGYPDADCGMCGCEIYSLDLTSTSGGYSLNAADCGGGTPSTSGATVTWSAAGLAMSSPNAGATNAVNASGDIVSFIPVAGDIIRLTGRRYVDNNNFVRVDFVTSTEECLNIGSGGFVSMESTAIEIDLSSVVDMEIIRVNIYVNNSISEDVGVIIERIYVGCP